MNRKKALGFQPMQSHALLVELALNLLPCLTARVRSFLYFLRDFRR